jgi:amino acid adenylation domain-containing protein
MPVPLNDETGNVLAFLLTAVADQNFVLQITASALCADAITLRNLAEEIAEGYSQSDLTQAAPPLQYADVSEWFHEMLAPSEATAAFLQKLDCLSVPDPVLPLEDRRVEPAFDEVDAYEISCSKNVTGAVRLAAERLGVFKGDLLSAAWSAVLWKLSGQTRIPVIRIGDGRSRPELDRAAGVFARPLPLVTSYTEAPTFAAIVEQTKEISGEASRMQDSIAPEEVLGPGDRRRLRVGFEYLATPALRSSTSVQFHFETLTAPLYPFKLKLTCFESGSGLIARFEYHPGLLERAEIARIAGYFERFIEQACMDPHRPVEEIDILGEAERRQILEDFNQTAADYPLDLCFHEMFEQQVERVPDRIALVFGSQRLTYRDLNAWANRLAHYLRSQNVRAGSRVGLFVERSAGMIAALLGILKAGAAYVPLHPAAPKARLAQQLGDTAVTVLITQESLLNAVPDLDCPVFCLDRDQTVLASQPESNPAPLAKPADPVYVIFTSGSTGTPKAVVTRHENVVNYTQSISRILKLHEPANAGGLTFANVSTLTADLGNTNIFAALASGGALHMIPDDVLMDPVLYSRYTADDPIDILKIAPSHLRTLLASGDPERILPRHYLVIGGERLTWEMVRQIEQAGRCGILNHYSPTETTIGALTFDVIGNEQLAAWAAVVPLGRGIGNTLLYVLDKRLKPVPLGVAGELLIGGAGVSNGYLNRSDLTSEKFIPDPVNPASGRVFYRSGDRARWLPGGIVEFLGREDDQVKIRGFRVELGEIEAVLSRHPSVRNAVVILKETPPAGEMLIACLVARDHPTQTEMRDFARRYLPDYMVPAHFVTTESFPLNANGKADRRALAASLNFAATAHEPAFTDNLVEDTLLGIWREVLSRADIGRDDDFFELGGHSLLATLVTSRARAAFQFQVPLRTIFEAPTVAGMAAHISKSMTEARDDEELARLLKEVEDLSEDEARKLLQE